MLIGGYAVEWPATDGSHNWTDETLIPQHPTQYQLLPPFLLLPLIEVLTRLFDVIIHQIVTMKRTLRNRSSCDCFWWKKSSRQAFCLCHVLFWTFLRHFLNRTILLVILIYLKLKSQSKFILVSNY